MLLNILALYHCFSISGKFDIALIVKSDELSMNHVHPNGTYLVILCLANVLRMFLPAAASLSVLSRTVKGTYHLLPYATRSPFGLKKSTRVYASDFPTLIKIRK